MICRVGAVLITTAMPVIAANALWAADDAPAPAPGVRNLSKTIAQRGLPYRVHVFEDYETQIEKRWWLRGEPVTDSLPPSLSRDVPNRRACRATETKDFDDKMGDPTKSYKAVIFNPVPGPPMGRNTRLSFRYRLKGADTLRVQIYSLSNGYHRHLVLKDLPQEQWRAATVDMTAARRPDGSGGPLAEDERIDDIQFYIAPDADLLIDDIVLYDEAVAAEMRPFPRRFMFTGWFDTGVQGKEWPGDFEIELHEKPLTWDAAKSVLNAETDRPWVRVHMRGMRPLSERTRLRFRYKLAGEGAVRVELVNSKTNETWSGGDVKPAERGKWFEASVDFPLGVTAMEADEIRFHAPRGATLWVDDVLLYEPGDEAE
jgi:hypothetical protein